MLIAVINMNRPTNTCKYHFLMFMAIAA